MPIYLKAPNQSTQTVWKTLKGMYLRNGDSWKTIKRAYIKTVNGWKSLFTGGGPDIDANVTLTVSDPDPTTGLITLTGVNKFWTNYISLSYKYEHSWDDGINWNVLKQGTATNASAAGQSRNQSTYILQDDPADLTANYNNRYRFSVTGVDSAGIEKESVSAIKYIQGVENITASYVSKTYNSVTFTWTAAPSANRYMIRYRKIESPTPSWTYGAGYATGPVTVSSLFPGTDYEFQVKGITGTSDNTGYSGNYSASLNVKTDEYTAPQQLTEPTISGSGVAFTSVTGTSGTYIAGSYYGNVNTFIGYYTSSSRPSSGVSSNVLELKSSNTYTITQADATTAPYYFYTVDVVRNSGNTTNYYFYSPGIRSFIGTVSDNFNRSSGFNTTSSGYTYSSAVATGVWNLDGSNGYVPALPVASDVSSAYPLRVVELTGKTDINASLSLPFGGSGPGIAFWVTSAGSWWAGATDYTSTSTNTTTTTYTCDAVQATFTNNAQDGSGVCQGCAVSSNTTGGETSFSSCGGTTYSTNPVGVGCYGCSVSTNTTTTTTNNGCTGSSAQYANDSGQGTACGDKCGCGSAQTSTILTCNGPTGTGSSCPPIGSSAGDRCSGCSFSPAAGYSWTTLKATTSTYYDCNYISCSDSTTTTYTCDLTFTTSPTVTSYYCFPKANSTTVTTFTYKSKIKILSASGSSVFEQSALEVASSTDQIQIINSIALFTSGNSVYLSGYNSSGTQMGSTLSYSASSPTKTTANGSSYSGIIMIPNTSQPSRYLDNLSIS